MGDDAKRSRETADQTRVCSPPAEMPRAEAAPDRRERRDEFDFGEREDEAERPSVFPDRPPPVIGRSVRRLLDASIRVRPSRSRRSR